MTDNNKVEVAIIMDRSGSMRDIKEDMEGGLRTFAEEQAKLPGTCFFSLYQFDDEFETVFEEKESRSGEVKFELRPRGWTALLDAVGKTCTIVGERIAKKPEHERPGSVVILVVTDGQENHSKEFSAEQVKKMVKHQEEVYKWKFVYLGSDLSTVEDAKQIGMLALGAYTKSAGGVKKLYGNTSLKVAGLRAATSKGGQAVETYDMSVDPNADLPEEKTT